MKNIAIIKYTIIFEPTETFSSGYQFENKFAKFFESEGFEAQMIEPSGGSGERAIFLNKVNDTREVVNKVPQPKEGKPASEQIKQVQTQQPTKAFKQFQERGVPKSFVDQDKRQPKPSFGNLGRTNRQKVKYG